MKPRHRLCNNSRRHWVIFVSTLVISGCIPVLSQLALDQDKYLGCIIKSNPPVPASFDTYWNQVTPENGGKWGSVEGTRDNYNWTALDLAYDHALAHGYTFRFHCLIWGKQQPGWIEGLTPEEQKEEVEEWFSEAGGRYPYADVVEVVNEAITSSYDPYPVYYQALGGEGETGWDWVIWAFEKAREYFPNSKLYINEYNTLSGGKSITKYLEIINLLKDRGLIDGICEQGHYFSLKYASVNTLRSNLDKFHATGLPVCISEFEIEEADDNVQLQKYQLYFPLLWEHPAVEGITLWGYREGEMWQPNGYLVRSRGTERPALEWLRDYLSGAVSVETGTAAIPEGFNLHQNFPNPFNPRTVIPYTMQQPSQVRLTIFDLGGRTISTLVNEFQQPGSYQAVWNGHNSDGQILESGVYIYELSASGSTMYGKMTLLR